MGSHTLLYDLYHADTRLPDPGNGGMFLVDRMPAVIDIACGDAETRTVRDPDRTGPLLFVVVSAGYCTFVISGTSYLLTTESSLLAMCARPSLYTSTGYAWVPFAGLGELQVIEGLVGPVGPPGDPGVGEQGPPGPQGPSGAAVTIVGSVATPEELPPSLDEGQGYLVAGTLRAWNGTSYTNLGSITGPSGPAYSSQRIVYMHKPGLLSTEILEALALPATPLANAIPETVTAARCYVATPATLGDTTFIIYALRTVAAVWTAPAIASFTIPSGARTVDMSALIGISSAVGDIWAIAIHDGYDALDLSVTIVFSAE